MKRPSEAALNAAAELLAQMEVRLAELDAGLLAA